MGTKNKRNNQETTKTPNAFRQAVEATAEIADGYCQGLQALRANATTVTEERSIKARKIGLEKNKRKAL